MDEEMMMLKEVDPHASIELHAMSGYRVTSTRTYASDDLADDLAGLCGEQVLAPGDVQLRRSFVMQLPSLRLRC